MPPAVILLNANDPEEICILQNDKGENRVFADAEAADFWLEDNAKRGWVTCIYEVD